MQRFDASDKERKSPAAYTLNAALMNDDAK